MRPSLAWCPRPLDGRSSGPITSSCEALLVEGFFVGACGELCYAAGVSTNTDGKRPSSLSSAQSVAHTPLSGRAHIVNRDHLHDEAMAGPGSLDPTTLGPPKAAEAKRWLAKRGLELEVPAGWRYLGVGNEGKSLTFSSDGTAQSHVIELHLWSMPADLDAAAFLRDQEEQVEEGVHMKRVHSHQRVQFGQAEGVVVLGWGPETRDMLQATSNEEIYLATDGTGRRSLSLRALIVRDDKPHLLIVAMSSPIESFMDARSAYDAVLARSGALN
jgi:hypothetical protein